MDEIRKQIPKGKWYNSRIFEDVVISTDMKMPVSELWAMDESDQAYVIAYYRVKAAMQAYEEFLHDRTITKKNTQKNKQGGSRPRRRRR